MNKKTGRLVLSILLAILFTGPVVVGGIGLHNYNTESYGIYKAQTWINMAESTTNYTVMAQDLQQTQVMLEHYHGNAHWFYPTTGTSWSAIKEQLNSTIQALSDSNSISGNNIVVIHQQLNSLNTQLTNNAVSLTANEFYTIFAIFYTIIGIMVVPICFYYIAEKLNIDIFWYAILATFVISTTVGFGIYMASLFY